MYWCLLDTFHATFKFNGAVVDGCLTFSDDVEEEETFPPEDNGGQLQPKEEVTPVST